MTATIDRPSSEELMGQLEEAGDKLRELRTAPPDKRGDTYERDLRSATAEVLALDRERSVASTIERDRIERAAWQDALDNPTSPPSEGPMAAFLDLAGEQRSAGQQVTESAVYEARTNRGFGEIEVRNLLTGSSLGTSGSHLLAPVGSPKIFPGTLQRRRPFVRDLIGVQQTGLQSIPYIREVSPLVNEGGASAVSEASAKPEVTVEFEQDDAPIRKLAAWIQATMEALDDAPTLRGYVDSRLSYMLMIREEQQLITGSGVAPNVKGLLEFDVQTNATALFYEAIGQSIAKIEAVDGDADGVVVNPLTFWAAVTDRHATQFDGQSQSGSSPFGTPQPTAWGRPVVTTRAVTEGEAIVGAFSTGATVFEKEGVTIRATDSHASLFVSNTVVILAEERVGLAVHRPDWFVLATITTPS